MRSSSQRPVPSISTAGRTCGGTTGSTVSIIHAGLHHLGSNPSILQSSSLMFFNILCTVSADKVCRQDCVSSCVQHVAH